MPGPSPQHVLVLTGSLVDPVLVGILVADAATTADLPVNATVELLRELDRLLEWADPNRLEVRVEVGQDELAVSGTFTPLPGWPSGGWSIDVRQDGEHEGTDGPVASFAARVNRNGRQDREPR